MLDNLERRFRHVTIDRHSFWVDPVSGRVLPDVRGGAEGDDPDDTPRSFTQAEVDRMVGQARTQARRTAATELAEELGCTVEEAKAKLAAAATAETEKMTEAERKLAEAATARTEADRIAAQAKRDRLDARIERKLLAAGVGAGLDEDKAEAALARAARLLNVPDDADDAAIAAEIDAAKADVPALFTTETVPPVPGRPAPKPPAKPDRPETEATTLADLGRADLLAAGIRPRDAA